MFRWRSYAYATRHLNIRRNNLCMDIMLLTMNEKEHLDKCIPKLNHQFTRRLKIVFIDSKKRSIEMICLSREGEGEGEGEGRGNICI